MFVFFFKQKTAYEMRISDWSSDVCSSDLPGRLGRPGFHPSRDNRMTECNSFNMIMTVREAETGLSGTARTLFDVCKGCRKCSQLICQLLQPLVTKPAREIGRAACRERVCQSV